MCTTQLTPEQKIDALKFISQTHRSLHDQRRKHESRVFFTTVTLFAIMAAARFTGQVNLPDPLPGFFKLGIWFLLIVMGGVSIVYLWGIHKANDVNKEFAKGAEDRIRDILKDNNAEIPAPPRAGKDLAKTRMWQTLMIAVLGVVAGFLLTCSNQQPKEKGQVPADAPQRAAGL